MQGPIRRIVLVTALVFVSTGLHPESGLRAQEVSAEYRADILRLLELTHAAELGEQMGASMADQMIQVVAASQSNVPARVQEIIREESVALMKRAFSGPDGLLDELVDVYARHLSQADLREAIEFFDTPAGRRMADAMPAIQQESMQAGQAWGERMGPELGQRIYDRLQEEGLVE